MSSITKNEILEGMEQEREERVQMTKCPISLRNEWDEMYRLAQLIKEKKAYITRSETGIRYTHIRKEKCR